MNKDRAKKKRKLFKPHVYRRKSSIPVLNVEKSFCKPPPPRKSSRKKDSLSEAIEKQDMFLEIQNELNRLERYPMEKCHLFKGKLKRLVEMKGIKAKEIDKPEQMSRNVGNGPLELSESDSDDSFHLSFSESPELSFQDRTSINLSNCETNSVQSSRIPTSRSGVSIQDTEISKTSQTKPKRRYKTAIEQYNELLDVLEISPKAKKPKRPNSSHPRRLTSASSVQSKFVPQHKPLIPRTTIKVEKPTIYDIEIEERIRLAQEKKEWLERQRQESIHQEFLLRQYRAEMNTRKALQRKSHENLIRQQEHDLSIRNAQFRHKLHQNLKQTKYIKKLKDEMSCEEQKKKDEHKWKRWIKKQTTIVGKVQKRELKKIRKARIQKTNEIYSNIRDLSPKKRELNRRNSNKGKRKDYAGRDYSVPLSFGSMVNNVPWIERELILKSIQEEKHFE